MPTGHTTTAQPQKVVNPKSSPKRPREQRSDDGPTILPGMEHFVDLLRKVKRPALVVRLLERANDESLPELQALADAAKGKLPVESRQAFFHCVAKLDAVIRQRLEDVAERVILLGDDYGAQAVQSVLDERREDDAAVLGMPSDRFSRALHLCILQEFPEAGVHREDRFDQAEHVQVMHRQWKSDQYSSHFLGPKGVVPMMGDDVQETLRTRIADLFPRVPKDQILIEQFTRHDLSHAQHDDDEDADADDHALLHTLTATFNGSTAHYQQVANGHVVDHEEPAAMSARFSWEPATGALTVVPVRMTIKPGGYDDANQGWGGGYATESFDTGSIYLAAEFVVTAGDHAKRKMWSNIGLHSQKGPTWGQMGRSFIRAALNSARNVHPQDNSPQASTARRIQGFHELDGLEFLARVDIEKDAKGQDRNVVKLAVEPDHPDYAKLKGVPPKGNPGGGNSGAPAQATPAYAAPTQQRAPVTGKPSWAQ